MGIPGAANPLLLRRAAAAGDDAYQIEKSLRFNDPDSPSLTKTFSTGNTRTWTWAAWVKRSTIGVAQNLFSAYADSNNQGGIWIENDYIAFDQAIGGTWSNDTKTTRLFRDPSAWFHITFVFDSTNALEADRIRFFINGERETSFRAGPTCTQNLQGKYNSNIEHQIGEGQNNSNYLDGYFADVHFIDGLALCPAAFGSFDSTGVWNPKAFELPAPNDGRTWSSNISNSTTPANAVDGDLATNSGGASNSITTFVFDPPLTNVVEFDHYTNDSGVHAIAFNDGTFEWDSGGSGQWRPTIPSIPSTISKVEIQRGGGFGTDIRAVRVNGVILVDGQTDVATWDKKWTEYLATAKSLLDCTASSCDDISDSNHNTADGGSPTYDDSPGTNSFGITECISLDGSNDHLVPVNADLSINSSTDTTIDLHFYADSGPITGQQFLYDFRTTGDGYCLYDHGNHRLQIKGSSVVYVSGLTDSTEDAWHHLRVTPTKVWFDGVDQSIAPGKTAIGSVVSGRRHAEANSSWYRFKGKLGSFRILDYDLGAPPTGGEVCVNGVLAKIPTKEHDAVNSFHLKFNDTSLNRYLGKDTLNGQIASATGGKPIYVTSDAYGDVKGSEYNSEASNTIRDALVLAIPGDSVASGTCDVHQQINTGSSNKTVTVNGSVTVEIDDSRLYGSSLYFAGAEDDLQFADHDDFNVGTGDYTIEFWAKPTNNGSWQSIVSWPGSWDSTAQRIAFSDSGKFVIGNTTTGNAYGTTTCWDGNWRHFALVRNGTTFKGYVNGVEEISFTTSASYDYSGLVIGRYPPDTYPSDYEYKGYLNDFRFYKGLAKYTANFTTPNRNDFTVNNLVATTYDTFAPAGPIYKTADKDDGFSDDSLKEYLRFACPCNEGDGTLDMNDYHATMGGTVGSNHVVSATGYTTQSSSSSTGWGHSADSNSNQATAQSSDFELSTSDDFCLEFWTYIPSSGLTSGARIFSFGDNTSSNISPYLYSNGEIYPAVLGGYMGATGNYFIDTDSLDAWYHWAFTRENGTLRLFGNGVLKASQSNTVAMGSSYNTMRIGGASNQTDAYYHDIRYYIGAAKYTTAFTPSRTLGQVIGDSLVDTPTNYGNDGGLGGQVRGNYCTYNAADNPGALTLSQGNLAVKGGSALGMVLGTMAMPAGSKFYWEVTINSDSATAGECYAGIANRMDGQGDAHLSDYGVQLKISGDPYFYTTGNTSQQSIGAWTSGETLGLAFDVDAGTLKYYRNNVLKYTHTSIPTTITWQPAFNAGTSASAYHHTNFGARAFKYTAPTGYKCLCTQNLDDTFSGEDEETVNNPSKYFDNKTWTGTGSNNTDYNFLKFQPDLAIIQGRSHTGDPTVFDAIRGVTKEMYINSTSAEVTEADGLQAFLSDGVELGQNDNVNGSGRIYAGYFWDAGTAAAIVSTAGSITPSAQWVNATAGFSITTWTDPGTSTTNIGHALGAPPEIIITKVHDTTGYWSSFNLYSKAFQSTQTIQSMSTNNNFEPNDGGYFPTAPDDTKVYFGGNNLQDEVIMYAWTSIPGYSAMGAIDGNNSSSGPFVFTGFRPAFILSKENSDSCPWIVFYDSVWKYNGGDFDVRHFNEDDNEASVTHDGDTVDILSNGFKIRANTTGWNSSTNKIIYMAFAEHPFKTARAR